MMEFIYIFLNMNISLQTCLQSPYQRNYFKFMERTLGFVNCNNIREFCFWVK
jgi:hypothetical protein